MSGRTTIAQAASKPAATGPNHGRCETKGRAPAPRRLRYAPLLLGAIAGLCIASCREATAVRVRLYSDVTWEQGRRVLIAGGDSPTVSEPSGELEGPWSSNELGDLVFVPNDDRSAPLRLLVVMGITKDPKECSTSAPDGCIFARRKLSFVPFRTLTVPITVHSACVGVPCGADSTCNALGRCVPAEVDMRQCISSTGCALPDDENGDQQEKCPDPANPLQPCTGPVATLALDDCSAADGVSGNTGSVKGTPTATTGRDNAANGACFFTKSQYVSIDNPETGSPHYTASAWVKVDAANHSGFASVLSRRTSSPTYAGYNLFTRRLNDTTQRWAVYHAPTVTGAGNPWSVVSFDQAIDDAWHHVAMSYDGTILILYVDGVERSRTTTTYNFLPDTPFVVGMAEGGYYFPGAVDDVRVFNRALPADEVAALAAK